MKMIYRKKLINLLIKKVQRKNNNKTIIDTYSNSKQWWLKQVLRLLQWSNLLLRILMFHLWMMCTTCQWWWWWWWWRCNGLQSHLLSHDIHFFTFGQWFRWAKIIIIIFRIFRRILNSLPLRIIIFRFFLYLCCCCGSCGVGVVGACHVFGQGEIIIFVIEWRCGGGFGRFLFCHSGLLLLLLLFDRVRAIAEWVLIVCCNLWNFFARSTILLRFCDSILRCRRIINFYSGMFSMFSSMEGEKKGDKQKQVTQPNSQTVD